MPLHVVLRVTLLCLIPWAAFASGAGGEEGSPLRDFGYQALNFILLIVVLILVARKPVREFFAGRHARIKGDLLRLLTAWNGGPGNLNKWWRKVKHNDDPLLFIESIPSRETRIFVERVLTNYWIYRIRFNQSLASMDAVARGKWPHYTSERGLAVEVAEDGQN